MIPLTLNLFKVLLATIAAYDGEGKMSQVNVNLLNRAIYQPSNTKKSMVIHKVSFYIDTQHVQVRLSISGSLIMTEKNKKVEIIKKDEHFGVYKNGKFWGKTFIPLTFKVLTQELDLVAEVEKLKIAVVKTQQFVDVEEKKVSRDLSICVIKSEFSTEEITELLEYSESSFEEYVSMMMDIISSSKELSEYIDALPDESLQTKLKKLCLLHGV